MELNENIDRRTFLKSAAIAGAGIPLAMYMSKAKGAEAAPIVSTTKVAQVSAGPAIVPPQAEVVDAVEGTELMLKAVAANGVNKIFFNGGTDNFHFMEYVAKFKALHIPTPDLVQTVHEHTGLCAAMGYFDWTRRPQFLILHVALGTIQPGGAWDEAWRRSSGVVVLAGSVGQTTKGELGYTTRGGIQFSQEVYNQEAMLGSYCKWNYKIERVENSSVIINTAFRMAATEPCGVCYMTYPMEVAKAPLDGGLLYDPAAFAPARPAQGDPDALREAARLLVRADNPVVMVKSMGRHPEAVEHLVALAEKLALPISSSDKYMNFPMQHWARQRVSTADADVILLIDNDVPWTTTDPPKDATIISLDVDPMHHGTPMDGIPVHIPITCNSALALPVLNEMCDEFINPSRQHVFDQRQEVYEAAFEAAQEANQARIEAASTAFPLSTTWIRECVNQVTDKNTVVLWDIGNIGQGDKTEPGHVFQMYGASLGSSWGRGIGIKMATQDAHQNKLVISSAGDGCTLYSEPIACLQLARVYGAPTLHIVNNNNRWNAVQGGLSQYGGANSYAGQSGYNGSAIKPSPDFSAIAQDMGAFGRKVTRPEEMEDALKDAIHAVQNGQAAVLDTVIVEED